MWRTIVLWLRKRLKWRPRSCAESSQCHVGAAWHAHATRRRTAVAAEARQGACVKLLSPLPTPLRYFGREMPSWPAAPWWLARHSCWQCCPGDGFAYRPHAESPGGRVSARSDSVRIQSALHCSNCHFSTAASPACCPAALSPWK